MTISMKYMSCGQDGNKPVRSQNGLWSNQARGIIRTNAGLVHWCINVSLSRNEFVA